MIVLDRSADVPLSTQIRQALRTAILTERLRPGQRLPSWVQMASELGVARGTVQSAYEWLAGEGLVTAKGPAGTYVRPITAEPVAKPCPPSRPEARSRPLQLGLPALDAFPRALWGRLAGHAARRISLERMCNPDPGGWRGLRDEIAAYVGSARGLSCRAEQVFITSGHRASVTLITRVLGANGQCWVEDPGYPATREVLVTAGLKAVPVPVDRDGLDVTFGAASAPDARYAAVTPSHQAPLGVPLTPRRRRALLDWAVQAGGWIIEDDYLGEFTVGQQPVPSLASLDRAGRTLYLGSLSKTMMPALRIGYVIVPPSLAGQFEVMAAATAPASGLFTQIALAQFMSEGHFGRHLYRMQRLYRERRAALATALADAFGDRAHVGLTSTGMHLVISFRTTLPDTCLAEHAAAAGLAASPLSAWSLKSSRAPALVLGFANIAPPHAASVASRLADALDLGRR